MVTCLLQLEGQRFISMLSQVLFVIVNAYERVPHDFYLDVVSEAVGNYFHNRVF